MDAHLNSSWLGIAKTHDNCAITMPFRDVEYGRALPPSAAFTRLINSYANVQRKQNAAGEPTVYPTSDIYICFCRTPSDYVAYFAGPRTRPRLLEYVTDNTNFFVVSLSCAGSYALLPVSQDELTDKYFLLEDLFPKWGKELTLKIGEATGIETKAALFEDFLRRYADKLAPFPNSFTHMLKRLSVQNNYDSYIKSVKDVGYTERHVRRIFLKYTGVSPYKYTRIVRCQTAIHVMRANPKASLAEIAFELNYCDQSHFTKEFKLFYDLTPRQFIKEFLQ